MKQENKQSLFYEIIGTGFFTGYLPIIPGTWGTWTAACLAWIFTNIFLFPIWQVSLFGTVICFIFGIYSAKYLSIISNNKDPSYIVIDEFAGIFLSYLLVPLTVTNFFLGFFIFRFFDIIKLWPIRNLEKLEGGWGIMLDDILAGVYTTIILFLIQYIN